MTNSEEHHARDEANGHQVDHFHGRTFIQWGAAIVGLIVMALLVTFGLWESMGGRSGRSDSEFRQQSELSHPEQVQIRKAYERQEKKKLTTYGWIDREKGIVRIPIERAMELSVERNK